MNYKGKEKTCQRMTDMLQLKVGARANKATPLEYKEATTHEEATSDEHKEINVNEEAKVGARANNATPRGRKKETFNEESPDSQTNETDVTAVDPSPSSAVPLGGKLQQEIRMSTRKRKLPDNISKDFFIDKNNSDTLININKQVQLSKYYIKIFKV
jgi:hypothetical protein